MTDVATTGKRVTRDNEETSESKSKFSKGADANRVVPRIVMLDMGGDAVQTTTTTTSTDNVVTGTSATSVGETAAAAPRNKVDWRKINNRELLFKLIKVTPLKKGQSYISFDVAQYENLTGQRVNLGQYNHLKVEGPWMQNIFGISSSTQGNGTQHTINYDIKDSSQDSEVHEFAQFVALCDEVALEQCIRMTLACDDPALKDWVDENKADNNDVIDEAKLRKKVTRFFNGALRCPKTSKTNPLYKPVPIQYNEASKRYVIPDNYFFRNKIRGKKGNDKALDIVCHTDEPVPRPIFYANEQALFTDHASYCKPQIEFSSICFVQKEFHSIWVTNKFRFRTKKSLNAAANANPDAADYDDMKAPVHASVEAQRQVQEEERSYLEKLRTGAATLPDSNVPTDE